MESIHFVDFLNIIKKKKILFLNFLLGTLTIALVINALQKPIYKTSVEILVERSQPEILLAREGYRFSEIDKTFFQTQFRLLKSDNILEKVINRISPDIPPSQKLSLKNKIKSSIVPKQIPGTRIFSIIVVGENPEWVAKVANTLAEVYVEENIEARIKASSQTFIYLNKRINELKSKLEKDQKELARIEQNAGVYTFISGKSGSLESSKLDDFNARYLSARAERVELESKLREFEKLYKEKKYSELKEVVDDPVINDLSAQLREAEISLTALKKEYLEQHPEVKKLQDKIHVLKQKIEEEGKKALARLKTRIDTLKSKEEALLKSLNDLKKEIARKNKEVARYALLKQEIATTQQLYDALLKKLQQMDISSPTSYINIRILTPAKVPSKPIKPKKVYNIVFGLIFGLFLGTGVVFLDEYLDTTIKTPSDVEKFLSIPVLGQIPYSKSLLQEPKLLYTTEEKNFHFLESFRIFRTNIQFSSIDNPLKVLLITSAVEKEGKTTIAANLAASFAKLGKKTLLMDGDLRKPGLHKIFNLKREEGLSKLLLTGGPIDDFVKKTEIENLYVIGAGPIPPNPTELLSSHRIDEVMKAMREKFDMIVIDSAPAVSVPDPVIMGSKCDGVVMVISAGRVPRELYIEAKKFLEKANIKIIGTVMNNRSPEIAHYYYYYKHYYYYYPKE